MNAVKKRVIGSLEKCYSIAPLHYHNKEHFIVAAEKHGPCVLFGMDGSQEEIVWNEPGGAMSLVPLEGTDGKFLATHKFYSPNDSAQARIVLAQPALSGGWEVQTLIELPFVHRFDVLRAEGKNYLIACTIKSAHAHKDDWSSPGKVYVAQLSDDLNALTCEQPLKLRVLLDGLGHNHGYCRIIEDGAEGALICADSGVYCCCPPQKGNSDWLVRHLIDAPCSDAVLVDFDGDGERELAVIEKFHGDSICIYKKTGEDPRPVYRFENAAFCHAIYGGLWQGKQSLIIGQRNGTRNLLVFTWDSDSGEYRHSVLDQGCGSANVMRIVSEGSEMLISANREINEVAMYQSAKESGKQKENA